jgi:hypothetical protein
MPRLPWISRRRFEAQLAERDAGLGQMVQDASDLKRKLIEARAAAEADRLLKTALRERFVVTLRDEQDSAFEGLLVDVDARTLVLVDAVQISRGGAKVGVDGALYLERSRVEYLQRPGGLPWTGEAGA